MANTLLDQLAALEADGFRTIFANQLTYNPKTGDEEVDLDGPGPLLSALVRVAAAARAEHAYIGPQLHLADTESGRLYAAVDTALEQLSKAIPPKIEARTL